MLKASQLPRKRFVANFIYEVTDGDAVIGTINDTHSSIDASGRQLNVHRTKVLTGPVSELKCGGTLIATATQKPFVNFYTLAHDGREWTFKAINLLATKFGLFQGEEQIGTITSGPWTNRRKGITADLPAELPLEVRMFLLLLAIGTWSEAAN